MIRCRERPVLPLPGSSVYMPLSRQSNRRHSGWPSAARTSGRRRHVGVPLLTGLGTSVASLEKGDVGKDTDVSGPRTFLVDAGHKILFRHGSKTGVQARSHACRWQPEPVLKPSVKQSPPCEQTAGTPASGLIA